MNPLLCGRHRELDLSRPQVMGILNVTPDSFSDGGRFTTRDAALNRAAQMVREGAAIIDVGGESTRSGAVAPTEQEEIDRVVPVVEAIASELDVCISVDTSTPAVMQASAKAGAHMINDVRALQRNDALDVAAASGLAVCLMHMQGEPGTMQKAPQYRDVVADVLAFLVARAEACIGAGIARERIVIDPGFGFGKTLSHNLDLLQNLDRFSASGFPVLAGISRKSMIGAVLAGKDGVPRPVDQRLYGSVSAAVIAALKGARIIRVHDVAPTADALAMVCALSAAAR